jgi:hypothetical protein
VRNLLLIINASRPGDQWVAQVQGCTEADLLHLVSEGLIEAAPEPQVARPVATVDADWLALQRQVRQMAYGPLYDTLGRFAKETLGLVKGYRFALEVERCSGPQELQTLALRLLDEVRASHGPAELKRFAQLIETV